MPICVSAYTANNVIQARDLANLPPDQCPYGYLLTPSEVLQYQTVIGNGLLDWTLVQWAFGAGVTAWAIGLGVGLVASVIRKAR